MRLLRVLVALGLSGCGGGTTGTNYSNPPPMAEIVATPTPNASPTPGPAPAAEAVPDDGSADNIASEG